MANNFTEQLFNAIDIIASKKVADLPYDKTVICKITDNTNAENGEYTVSDGTSEYLAYSENTSYRVSSKVYVTIPGSDMLNKKLIVGLYIEDSNGIYETYISPMNNFVDCTGDLALSTLTGSFSLLANDKDVKFKTIWDSGIVSYKDFTCLGIQGEFMSIFNGEKPVEGNYGLAIYILFHRSIPVLSENGETKIEIQDDLLLNKVYYLDSSDMFGDSYNFETGYLQEKIFEIVGMAEIVNIQLAFYLSENFKLEDNSAWDNSGMLENLFVSNVQLKLGELLSDYEEDTLKLICNDKLSYRCDELPLERTMYLRWIHLIEESAIVIDETEDVELADELTVENTLGVLVPNWRLHWYRYNMVNGVKDKLAGNFWVELEADESIWSRTIIPNDTVQHDKWKVILEYPRADVIYDSMIELTDANYQALFEAAVAAVENTTASVSTFTAQVNAYITDTPLGEDDTIIDFYDVYCNNQALYPILYKSEDIANLKTYITERKSVINYYTSNIITFDNEILVSLEAVDLVLGLTIEVDTDPTGYNGHYFIYDEGHNIINSHEASKTRIMTAKYTSIATGEDELTQAEEILWCFPLENSMIEMPQEGKEYSPDNGDIYLVTNQLNKTLSVENELNERSELLKEKRAESYTDDLMREVKELQDRMVLEILSILVNSNLTLELYQAEVNNIKEYYNLAINYAINRDYSSLFDSFPACRYGIIHRTGGELVGVTDLLIETALTFRIKNYYAESATNNTIFCFVKKRGRYYKAETLLQFGTAGTSGTELTLKVSLRDANNREVSALTLGGSVTVMAELYDYNNQLLPFTSAVGFKWFSKPLNEGAITITPVDNCAILTSNIDYSNPNGVEPHAHAILQIETEYGIAGDITVDEDDETEIDRERMVTLTSYLPIPVRRSEHFSHISGATLIIYDSNGVNPSYYKSPYCIYSDENKEELQSAWSLLGTDDELYYDNSRRYYPTLTEYGELLPTNMYYNNIKPISVLGYVVNGEVNEETGVGTFSLAWVLPIFIGLNKYGSTMLNNWDGSLLIDEKNGTIMSAMVGAGIKNEDNTFSGALMGNVALADEKIGNKTGLGIYGFDHGELSFGLNVDGTAFFGKAGKGRIEFDGNKGLIKSYNYEEPKRSVNNDTVTQTTGEGIQIDLDDSTFKSYGSTGSVVINTNKYGQPLFVIRDAPTVENSKGNALFYISSNSYDPAARRSYDAKYYLQSSNYNDKDPDSTLENYPEGARFDLEYGRLDIHGKAGRVFINGSGNSDLFKIKGWKTSGGNLISNTLMNVSPNYYYLLSLDYKANQKGFKLDMLNGRILASDFNLKAGTDATGKILINTNGSPYLSITSGKDYIEEEVNGQIHYVAYNAIDVANVDARFEANRYYVKNKRTSGHYGVEDYLGKYVCGNELIPTMDEEERKTQYYYTQRKNESGELVYDELGNIIYDLVIAPMWPNDTRSFAASRLPDAERLYIRLIAPIKLDDKSYYRTTVHYYTDIDGTTEITDIIKNPANNYYFTDMRDAGKLYKLPKTPLSAAGTAYVEGRRYYEKVGNDYVEVKRILPNSADCVLWLAKLFYFCTDFGLFVFSTLHYAGDLTYYVPVDGSRIGDNGYTNTELKNLTSAAFIPSPKKVVHPNTKFYDLISNSLYYYSNDWSLVGKDEIYDDTLWRYGLKLGTNNSMSTGKTVVADNVPIYKSGTYYVKDDNDFVYVEATTWDNNATYYYLWYDLYEECTKVIPDENEEFGYIFEPNKYFEYVSNKPYILAKEFDSTDVYYTDLGLTVITLCDLDFTPYITALSLYNNNSLSLVYLNNGAYTTAPPVANFIEGAEYYVRTDYGTTISPESSLNSVKLVNITKSKFELKSHNWNSAAQTGMYFHISSNASASENDILGREYCSVNLDFGTIIQGLGLNSDNDNSTTMYSNGINRKVGGGYITGYGYYQNSAGAYISPNFTLDWRAGGSHYPIDVNSGMFRVWWNGRVDISDLHAYQGRIGAWYIDHNGIYSYNPNKTGYGEGVALVKNGLDGSMTFVNPLTNSNEIFSNRDLRIVVGNFSAKETSNSFATYKPLTPTGGTVSIENDTSYIVYALDDNGNYVYTIIDSETGEALGSGTLTSLEYTAISETTWVSETQVTDVTLSYTSTSTGFCVYKNGLMRAYGATLKGARINKGYIINASIKKATIHDVQITSATISSSTISSANIGVLRGGTISGSTITAGTISGGTISGATITGTSISGGSITGTNITGGKVSGVDVNALTVTCTGLLAKGLVRGPSCNFNTGAIGKITGCTSINSINITDIVTSLNAATKLGLKAMAYKDSVSINMTPTLSGSVSVTYEVPEKELTLRLEIDHPSQKTLTYYTEGAEGASPQTLKYYASRSTAKASCGGETLTSTGSKTFSAGGGSGTITKTVSFTSGGHSVKVGPGDGPESYTWSETGLTPTMS